MSTATSATKKKAKGVKYAKDAAIGQWVHAKGKTVTNPAELRRWFGSKYMSKYLSGVVLERTMSQEIGRKGLYYTVKYELPGGKTATVKCKATSTFPNKWVDPDPPPDDAGPRAS